MTQIRVKHGAGRPVEMADGSIKWDNCILWADIIGETQGGEYYILAADNMMWAARRDWVDKEIGRREQWKR